MSVQGHILEITVIGCKNLRDTEWLSRQDPYVVLEYAGTRYRTRTDTDGGRHPSFNEKYSLSLIEGLKEINVQVWNSNTLTQDDFIGSGKILIQKALSAGYDDSTLPLTSKSGRRAGEMRVIMHYTNPNPKERKNDASSGQAYYAPPSVYPPAGQQSGYPPPPSTSYYPQHPPQQSYGQQGTWYVPPGAPGYEAYSAYPPPQAYPPQAYPPQAYPPPTYQGYPPPSGSYGAYPTYPPYGGHGKGV